MATDMRGAEEGVYRALLLSLVEALGAETAKHLLPAFAEAQRELKSELVPVRQDAWPKVIETAISRIRLGIKDRLVASRRVARQLGESVRLTSLNDFARTLTGVTAFKREPYLKDLLGSWSQENSKLITSIPEQYLGQVAQRAQDMVRSGSSYPEFVKELSRTYSLTTKRAELIARTEVAKLNGQITRARQMKLGISEYEWLTSADERVRESHRVLDGKICRWDDNSVYREHDQPGAWRQRSDIGGYEGIPGSDFQCRCSAAALVESFLDSILEREVA